MEHLFSKVFVKIGLNPNLALAIDYILLIATVVFISWLANYLIKRYIVAFIHRKGQNSRFNHFRLLSQHQVFQKISHLAPSIIIAYAAPLFIIDQVPFTTTISEAVQTATKIYFVVVNYLIACALLDYAHDVYKKTKLAQQHHIKSYIQVLKIALFLVQVIIAISILINKSPLAFLTGLGAMTAFVSLMLKDSLLGFVASIQLSSYDMIRVGDWIEVPSFGADGDVIDMSLNAIKVQNFDKTIVTIPTPALLSTGIKNWRGMSETGARRIKRAIYIDLSSIRFCNEAEIQLYRQLPELADFLNNTKDQQELPQSSPQGKVKLPYLHHHQYTNITLFRAYLKTYLIDCAQVRNDLTMIVRQLDITGKGLPIEIYVFANTTDWLEYESIQADLFDHFLAMMPFFHLRVYQDIIDRSSITHQPQPPISTLIEDNRVRPQENL